jgi:lipopolysaccharide transport protein LptA
MARFSVLDGACGRRPAGALLLLALLACNPFPQASAAGVLSGSINWEGGDNLEFDTRTDSWSLDDAVLRHGTDTRLRAEHARGAPADGGTHRLDLSGAVHIEFRGAVLDAETAVIIIRGQQLLSVRVQGSQAQFSHQPAGSARRIQGRGNAIDYDAATNIVTFTGNNWFTASNHDFSTDRVDYNIGTGKVTTGRGSGIIRPERERVPPPRTPERGSAQ